MPIEQKHQAYELYQMQSLPLEQKILMSKRRIREWYDAWDGDVYVSFSGGKDSTALLHLVRSMYPDVQGVFVDTGLEYPEIRDFVKTWDNITILKPAMNFKQVILKYGYPIPSKALSQKIYYARSGSNWAKKYIDSNSRYGINNRWKRLLNAPFNVSARCCYVMKKAPIKVFEKETKLKSYIGTMADESENRLQAWCRTGCNAFTSHPHSAPLSFWTQNDVLLYLKQNDIKIADVYGKIVDTGKKVEMVNGTYQPLLKTTGVDRTGCMFCMYGCHLEQRPNRFDKMKVTHPKQYEWCMKPVSEGGLGLDEVLTYCDVPHDGIDEQLEIEI